MLDGGCWGYHLWMENLHAVWCVLVSFYWGITVSILTWWCLLEKESLLVYGADVYWSVVVKSADSWRMMVLLQI